MSRESYIRGFCKAAEAHGVDPVQLAKFAATNSVATAAAPVVSTPKAATKPVTKPVKSAPSKMTPPKGLEALQSVNPSFSDWINFLQTMPRYSRDEGPRSRASTQYGKDIEDGAYEIAPDVVKTLPNWAIDDALANLDNTRARVASNTGPVRAADQVGKNSQISPNDLARLIYAAHTNNLHKVNSPDYRIFGQK